MFGFRSFLQCLLAASLVGAAPSHLPDAGSSLSLPEKRDATATGRLVFCHFMVGIISARTSAADWDSDMKLAKELGIDAFALNIGTDDFTDTQLGYAYESAANNNMSVFISFDFNWFDPSTSATQIGQMIANYSTEPAQLKVDGKVFASSFMGDGFDVSAMRSAAAIDVFFAPNFHPEETTDPSAILDGAFNWMGWASNGNNKAPSNGGTRVTVVQGDHTYKNWLSESPYIAPVSPWFSTHYGPEVSYSKNFVFPSDLLWFTRWNEILAQSPRFVEMITWNDYGESHYIGPLSSSHNDDGASKWVNDMPHDGFRDLAKPFIAAYKAGATSVDSYISEDQIIYWYRPTLSTVECDSTDNTMGTASNSSGNYYNGKPNGYQDLEDAVFVVTLLTANATLSVTSGGTTKTFDAKAGANSFQVDMEVGQQSFSLTRDSKAVLSGTSLKDIQDSCICGMYNFNTYVGTLPAGDSPSLDAAGLALFTEGLSVTTCSATPSLGTANSVTASATATESVVASSTGGSQATTIIVTQTTTAASGSQITPTSSSPSQTRASASASRVGSSAAASSTATSTSDCNAGTVASGVSDNLLGLCTFACAAGFCPSDACTCTSTGTAVKYNAGTAASGCAKSDEDSIYDTLCAYTCQLGYCPDTACSTDCSS